MAPTASELVVEEGLLMATIGPLLVVRFDDRLTPQSFGRYRAEWLRAVDARTAKTRAAAFYDIPTWIGITATQRREWAEMLKSRAAILRGTTASMTLATPSLIARGALSAIFWLAPPPYAHAVLEHREHAFAFHARHLPDFDVAAAARLYDELVRTHVPTWSRR